MTSRLTIRWRQVPHVPVVALRVWLVGGSRAELQPGEALVTARMLTEGTRRRDWRRIAELSEVSGIDLDGFATLDVHGLAIDALSRDLNEVLEWAAELLLESDFPEERCRWVARQAAGEWMAQLDQPEVKTAWVFNEQLYAPNPAGRPLYGSLEALAEINTALCASYHRSALSRRVIVAVAGAIEGGAVEEGLSQRLAILSGGQGAPDPVTPAPEGGDGVRRTIILEHSQQAHLYLGALTVPRRDPDYEALEVASTILGGGAGLSGRIPGSVREERGLAYAVHANAVAGAGFEPGHFVVYAGCLPRSLVEVESVVRDEVARFVEHGPTASELENAISYLLGRDSFQRQTAAQWASILAVSELYGLRFDRPEWRRERLAAVDRGKVMSAAARYLDPARMRLTVGVPAGHSMASPGMMIET